MKSIESFTHKELVDLLNKCWMSHDSMWFFQCLQEFGIETANRINKASIQSLSAIEIKRIKSALGINDRPIKNFEEFKDFFMPASHLVIPDFMNVTWDFPGDNILKWEFDEGNCFAFKGISRLGVIDTYECGVIFRVQCWLDELGIGYKVNPEVERCLMLSNGKCSGNIQLDFNK